MSLYVILLSCSCVWSFKCDNEKLWQQTAKVSQVRQELQTKIIKKARETKDERYVSRAAPPQSV